MPASRIHLVRHGEVDNPEHVLYGRLDGFGLSPLGVLMAQAAADELAATGRAVNALFASPLLRAQQSAAPISAAFDLPTRTDQRFLEPTNVFEGKRMRGQGGALRDPRNWRFMVNPWRPSWGEPFSSIVGRVMAGIVDADASVNGGDVVIVSHQSCITMIARTVAGSKLAHNPATRRCNLSSITTLEKRGERYVEVGYLDPAAHLSGSARDVGAV